MDDLPCPLQSLCRHAITLAPRRVSPLRGRNSHHSNVPRADVLVIQQESYLNDLQRRFSEWRIAIKVSKMNDIIFASAGRRFFQQQTVTLFGEPILWVDTTRYLVVTLDIRLTWSPHIHQVRKRPAQRMGMLSPLLSKKSDLSVRTGVLLYKQLIRPMMDYVCHAWRSATHTHVRRLQVLQPKFLHLAAGAPGA